MPSCLPSNLRIDGVLNSFLDEPLPHSGNGGGVDQKHTGYLTVPKSFICFEQRQRPLDGADGRLAPAGNLIEMAPFRFTQLDFILDGSHVWALPHRKIIPKHDCLLILLQIYLEMVLVGEDIVYIGRVNYVDYDTTFIPENDTAAPFLHKRKSFEHEREVRAIIQKHNVIGGEIIVGGPDIDKIGTYYEVDISTLVNEVIVPPYAEDWFLELVQTTAETFGLQSPVTKSSLATPPIWT